MTDESTQSSTATLSPRPLQGIRVLDFAWSVAGPTITKLLAALGAEVIKVEWPTKPDMMRMSMFKPEGEITLDSSCFFATVNPGKTGFSVNVRTDAGFAVIERLVRESDIVTESFSAGVLERWGLPYERLEELHPGVVYLSLSGFGHNGRLMKYETWGPTAQSYNGLTGFSGLPGHPPAGWGHSYADMMAGYEGALAVLMAIYHRRRTGEGQHIDMAQVETGLSLLGATLLDASVNRRGSQQPGYPPGNRSVWSAEAIATAPRGEAGAPYNCYPTRGADDWSYCAITVLSDDQWVALKGVMGSPAWAQEARFDTVAGRIAGQDDLDAHISEWTLDQDKFELMALLQQHGVPAGALQSFEEIVESDPQLAHRGFFVEATHPLVGTHRWESIPIAMTDPPIEFHAQWPLLGEGNDHVLKEVLGMTDDEVKALDDANVTWPAGMPRRVVLERGLW